MWLLSLSLFCFFVLGVGDPCEDGLGDTTSSYVSPYIPAINLHRPEGGAWFWQMYMSKGRAARLLQTTMFEGFFPDAIKKWHVSGYLDGLLSKHDLQVLRSAHGKFSPDAHREQMTFGDFRKRSKGTSSLLLFSEMPSVLEADINPKDPDLWKSIPCFHEGRHRRFPLHRWLVAGEGNHSSDVVSLPHDSFIYVVSGQRKVLLFPPNSQFFGEKRVRSPLVASTVSKWEKASHFPFEVNLNAGEMLYIPAFFFFQSHYFCRHVSVETRFDLRQMLSGELRQLYESDVSNAVLFNRSTSVDEAHVAQVCDELRPHWQWDEIWLQFQRNLTVVMGVVVVLLLAVVVYVGNSILFGDDDIHLTKPKKE